MSGIQKYKVEKTDHFNFGFVLNEQNIRWLVSTAKEQLDKIEKDEEKKINYKIVLENGSVINGISLDEILDSENNGSYSINEFELCFTSNNEINSIKVNYSKINRYSVSYYISSLDKDWVANTLGLINEKIISTKRDTFCLFKQNNFNKWMTSFLIGLIIGYVFIVANPTYKENTCNEEHPVDNYLVPNSFILENLKKEFSGKPNINISDALVMQQKIILEYKNKRDELDKKRRNILKECYKEYQNNQLSFRERAVIGTIIMIVFPLLTYCYSYISGKLYPAYVFCWGTEKDFFIKKEAQRKFILVTIITGLLVSIIAGILVNFFG